MGGNKSKLILGLLLLLAVLVTAGVLFIRYEIRKSFPVTDGTIQVAGLRAPVVIGRDTYGVPRIQVEGEEDMFFGQGFVHAQDRLWQMDIQRRAAAGRLSEIFGSPTVSFDRMFRIIGLRSTAEEILTGLSPGTREILESYCRGVNAFLESERGKYPAEFDLIGYTPEPWTPLDCILVARLMAWELNLAWWTDLTYGAIAERVGLEKTLDILPAYPSGVPPTVRSSSFSSAILGMLRTDEAYRRFMGVSGFGTGSNVWAVAPWKSVTGSALLANDTHLHLLLPSHWYEAQLRCPAYSVWGMTVPGAPGVVAGRNDSIAWGVTNLMADDADFYVERIDSSDTTRYWDDGAWHPLSVRVEQIPVRGDSAVSLVVRATRNGPIVTDVSDPVAMRRMPYVASMRWTGRETDDPFAAFLAIGRARNWSEFSDGVGKLAVPGQNFVYADVRGNIGYRCGARIPIRPGRSSLLPLPGWDRSLAWKGFVPPERLPFLFNPPEGYVATANNKVADNMYPYHIGDLWEPPSRILRLREILGKKEERFSVQDFERLQNDTYSHHAREIVPYIYAAFSDSTATDPEDVRLLEYFRNWNFYFSRDDIATAIYQVFWIRLLNNMYRDEMGNELFHDFLILVNVPVRVTTRLLQEGTSPWFDDITTASVENRDDIVRKSLREAGEELRRRLGGEPRDWRWGSLHTVTLKHLLGLQKPLDRIFNLGPYPVGGASTALTSFEYDHNAPFEVTVGPSFRQIFDLGRAEGGRAVLAGGQSGQIFHPHYDDQTSLWLNGGYRMVSGAPPPPGGGHLRLEPLR
jgi:penicillin G amidase